MTKAQEKVEIKKIIEINEKENFVMGLRERYLQRLRINGNNVDQVLGALQGKIRENEAYIRFLEEILTEK
jgi:hypothetical protein